MTDQYDVQAEGKKKPAHRFTTPQDVDLLKEVMSICPHDAPYGQTSARWAEKATLASLRASGTDEEYDEREQLLQDLSDMIDMISNKKKATKEDKCKKMDKRESDDHTVRVAALTGMKRKSLGMKETTTILKKQRRR
ncbi:hypothetical protein H257_16670 [Aphanomyces astaci]|uniref:Uncharacterized protein n=1 Tax=Aphanomyces astaci TaxID=112090 RepID=W4FK91_APHAT|nr:hypothetical protein H257_16670 [Aphanomyces astaci]ETV67128.1 hypothetical protein H257_16670 [Aphanomyces astaci]|eukprot:XP_009843497.1 hypothetical protein H257_16670 [Aphanomyces astaci]